MAKRFEKKAFNTKAFNDAYKKYYETDDQKSLHEVASMLSEAVNFAVSLNAHKNESIAVEEGGRDVIGNLWEAIKTKK
jgi:hypothetical protein